MNICQPGVCLVFSNHWINKGVYKEGIQYPGLQMKSLYKHKLYLMKNTVSNVMSIKLAISGFILAGLFLFAPSHIQAQTTTDLLIAPNVTYVSPSTAITRVEEKILSIKSQIETVVHGSQAHADLTVEYSFYEIILTKLQEGKTTKESLQAGLTYFGTDAASLTSKANMIAYRQEAINLLKL